MAQAWWARKKSIDLLQQEYNTSKVDGQAMRRTLGLWQLTGIGLGGIIGVGIFVLTGIVAATQAGPGVTYAFMLAGIASAAAALCYAEFASMIPVAGSAYTYSYATMGEGVAWMIGWDLILEYALVVAVVAIGWSGYAQALLAHMGMPLPVALSGAWDPELGKMVDLPAVVICLLLAFLLSLKTEMGARFNTVLVFVKLFAAILVIVAGVSYIDPANWDPFLPFGFWPHEVINADGTTTKVGVVAGAAVVFFAVFGYDTLTTAAEESKNPQRDLPLAVVMSLGIALVLYVAMSLVLTGIVPYTTLNNAAPVAHAFDAIGLPWVTIVVSIAAVAGITSVIFAFMLACARITFAMSRDGLLPRWLSVLHPEHRTPQRPTMIVGVVTAVVAGIFPIGKIAELVNMGTLSAFVLICAAVLLLRKQRPELHRGFRVPLVPVIPIVGIGFSLWLMSSLPVATWHAFGIWLGIGAVVYLGYGKNRSLLAGK